MRVTAGAGVSENPERVSSSSMSLSVSMVSFIYSASLLLKIERMAIPVLIDQIPRRRFAQRAVPLRTIGRHPDEVTGFHRIPVFAEPINTFAFEHQQTVLHDVNLN